MAAAATADDRAEHCHLGIPERNAEQLVQTTALMNCRIRAKATVSRPSHRPLTISTAMRPERVMPLLVGLPLLSSVWIAIHSATVTFVAACLA